MSELRELYQQVIIEHGRHPRNFGPLQGASGQKEGYNPLCGDKMVVYILEREGVIEKLQFEGAGCAISMASASLMTECLQGKTIQEFHALFNRFHQLVTQQDALNTEVETMGKLAVLKGVAEFPARVKCATLAWHTLRALLEHDELPVSTEG